MGKRKIKKMPLSVNWGVEDDRELRVILQSEIKSLTRQIADASYPSRKRKLRAKREKYRETLRKINNGDYGSEQFFLNEQNQGVYVNPFPRESSEAVSAYDDISFRYDAYFRKKRYYGFMLPLLLLVFFAALIFLPFLGNILPAKTQNETGAKTMHLGALITFKIDENHDFLIKNDGNWPVAVWAEGMFLPQGTLYKDGAGGTPDTVSVYKQLGIRSIDVTGLDLLKAFLRTDIFKVDGKDYQIDAISGLPFLQGDSWYYYRFMYEKDMTTTKTADGTFDWNAVLRIVSTNVVVYGFLIGLVAAVLALLFSIASMFGYVSRRIHLLPLLAFIVNLAVFLLPAFLAIDEIEIKQSFNAYFLMFSPKKFADGANYQVMTGLIPILTLALSAIATILPKLFKNKLPKYQTYVPKGNKPRRGTYDEQIGNE